MASEPEVGPLEQLTAREREVQQLLRLGLTDAEIAQRLGISAGGASYHVAEIIGKLGVRNRYEAAAWPKRPPWWTTALAPMALFWRKAGAALPVQPGSVALALSGGLFVAALGGLGLMAFLLLGGGGDAAASLVESETQNAIADPVPVPTAGGPGGMSETETPTAISHASSAPAPGGSGGMAVDCAAAVAGIQSECAYPAGAAFSIRVHVTQAPEAGYFGFQTKLRWEAAIVSYLPSEDPGEEALWPECDVPARRDNQPQGDPSLLFGCVPLSVLSEGSTDTGAVLQLRLQCQQEGSTPLVLVPRQGDTQGGTVFLNRSLAPIDPVLTSAQVTCGSPPPCPPGGCSTPVPTIAPPPTATPLPTPQPVATPIPTATPQPTSGPPTPTPGGSGGMAVDCDAAMAGIQSECAYPSGARFGVEIHVTHAPEEGYFGFAGTLQWTDAILGPDLGPVLLYGTLWEEPCHDHNVVGPASVPVPPLRFACMADPRPVEGSTTTGAIVELLYFRCQEDGSTPLGLAPRANYRPLLLPTVFAGADDFIEPLLTDARVTCGTPPPTPTPVPTPTPCPPELCVPVPFEAVEIEPAIAWRWCLMGAAHTSDPSLFSGSSLFAVIGDTAEWERLWNLALELGTHCDEIGPAPSLPLDFDTEMMILLAEGYSTGGYLLAIDQVSARPAGWTVEATRTVPGDHCLVTFATENRYRAIAVPRTDLPVKLSVGERSYDC